MAALQLTEASLEIANSISQNDIPIKLRCAICNRLVINAFRLPCCNQSICEPCQSTLPDTCPVCTHSPLSADDCTPNKNLRMTVKVFLKKEENKRGKEQGSVSAAPTTPTTPAPPATPVVAKPEQVLPPSESSHNETEARPENNNIEAEEGAGAGQPLTSQALASLEDKAENPAEANDEQEQEYEDDEDASSTSSIEIKVDVDPEPPASTDYQKYGTAATAHGQVHGGQKGGWNTNGSQGNAQTFGNHMAFGPDQSGFSGMGWNGAANLNDMMQMSMQNAMPNGNWGGFPNMLGMSNMGMDPMAMSQAMFGGYGMQNMGMDGLNNMNGINGMMGMCYDGNYGVWNGQQMNSGFGTNAGYYPGGGYNQQSHQAQFHHMNHPNQSFPKNNYYNRFNGRGRGRGQGYDSYTHRGYSHNNQGFTAAHHGSNQTQAQAQVSAHTDTHAGPNQNANGDGAFIHQLPTGVKERHPSQQETVENSQANSAHVSHSEEGAKGDASHAASVMEGQADAASNECSQGNAGSTHEAQVSQNATSQNNTVVMTNDNAGDEHSHNDSLTQNGGTVQLHSDHSPTNQSDVPFAQGTSSYSHPHGASHYTGSTSYGPVGGHSSNMGMTNEFSTRGRGGMRGRFGRGEFGFRGAYGGRGGRKFQAQGYYNAGIADGGPQPGDITQAQPPEPKGVGVEGAPTGPKAMREGQLSSGLHGRRGSLGTSSKATTRASLPPDTEAPQAKLPEYRRSRSRSPSRSRSRSHSRSLRKRYRQRSMSPSTDDVSREKHRDRKRYRSSRKYEDEDDHGDQDLPERKEKASERSRDASVESRHRSRRDKEKYHSSRSHRDSSRERRRHRHRSRSRSPINDETLDPDQAYLNGTEAHSPGGASRRKPRSEKYRDRDREREDEKRRARDRDRERDRDRDPEREKDRKKPRRDRSVSPHDYTDEDRRHTSHRSRKDRDRDRERDRERERDARTTEDRKEHETEFKFQGRSKDRTLQKSLLENQPFQPPTGPRSQMQPPPAPKGPAADRRRLSQPQTPTTTVASSPTTTVDPHTLEREARNRERMLKEEQRRMSLQNKNGPLPSSSTRKRSFSDLHEERLDKPFDPPTGPSAERKSKGGGSRDDMRGKKRRVSYKYEDEENDEQRARRVESEREAGRWR